MNKVFIQFYLSYLLVSAGMLLVYKLITDGVEANIVFAFCSISAFVVGKLFFGKVQQIEE